jgi:NAD(P)H-dependent flavin oxidoreductase YrpB (nitropropane dioxygenase family)
VGQRDLTGFPTGQIIGRVDRVRPARDVIFDLVEEWIDTTQRLAGMLDDDA